MTILKQLIVFVPAFILSFQLFAQIGKTGKVTGSVLYEVNKPAETATVTLRRSNDSVLVKTALPDKEGLFELEHIPAGTYFVSVMSVGYSIYNSAPFVLDENNLLINLSTILLTVNTRTLSEVKVEAKKPFIERKLDKVIVNVAGSITAAGGTAFEVLERSPGVVVDQNDNINLKGKPGVIIMINGKPAVIAGKDLANYLRGLPADAIEKIELISNPSARYDAAGNAGIINIVMKKDQRMGTNGTVTINYGQGKYPKTGQGISFNNRNRKVNIFGNYNFAYRKAFSHLTLYRKFLNNGNLEGIFDQDNYITFPFKNHIARTGLDYTVSNKTVIGVLVSGLSNQFNTNGDTHTDVLNANEVKSSFNNNYNRSKDLWYNFAANANLKHSFDTAGKELNVDADIAWYGNNTDQHFTTRFYNLNNTAAAPDYILMGDVTGRLSIKSIKADYVNPLRKDAKIEAGIKSSIVKADNDLKYYDASNGSPVFDPGQSNRFIYDENINAAYINYSKEYKKINFQVGLRLEQTNIKGNQLSSNEKFDSSYLNLFPSAFLNYKVAAKHELGFSVSRRLDRPNYRQLNPFKFFINNSTYSEGNPYLRPQYTYSFELSHTYDQKITTTLSYSITKDNITEVIFPSPNIPGITLQTFRNLTSFEYAGLNIAASYTVTKWWNNTSNIDLFYGHYKGNLANTTLSKGNVNVNVNTNNSFTIGKKGYTAELVAAYNGASVYGYMEVRPSGHLTLGMQKTIMKKKGTVRLNLSDIFYTNIGRATTAVRDYIETFRVERESRVLTLSFSYRFGNNKVAAARRRTSGAEQEKQRAQ